MKKVDQYAVFGNPINHSKSPAIHKLFAEQTGQVLEYTAQEVPIEDFKRAVAAFFIAGGKGLNLTLPLKGLAYDYPEHKTERAVLAKAVNTLALQADGTLLGDNTDGVGLIADLTINNGIQLKDKNILILGAGGASRGIIAPILQLAPKSVLIANRCVEKAMEMVLHFSNQSLSGCGYGDLTGKQFDLIINATSASLTDQLPPLPEGLLAPQGNCYDLAYGTEPTAFVRWGQANGAEKSLDGLGMLVEQAAEAFYIWRGVKPKTQPVIALLRQKS
jgi:shikimate dehydrogenase